MKAMKYINKIINNLITDIYKIDILRTSIVLIRFFYFFYLKRSIKYHIDPDKKTDDHITINKNSKKHTVISHNMHFSENLKNFRGTFRKFDGSKTVSIVYPFKSIDFINYEENKVLSVGPRNEGELFLIRSLGFKWKNIHSIDLISYSKLTKLGDIHKSEYADSSFDIIVCGWVLSYSNNFEKTLDELLRITKNKGLISIGFSYIPREIDEVREFESKSIILDSTEQILKKYQNNIEHVYFNFDARKSDPKQKRHSILIVRIKK